MVLEVAKENELEEGSPEFLFSEARAPQPCQVMHGTGIEPFLTPILRSISMYTARTGDSVGGTALPFSMCRQLVHVRAGHLALSLENTGLKLQ